MQCKGHTAALSCTKCGTAKCSVQSRAGHLESPSRAHSPPRVDVHSLLTSDAADWMRRGRKGIVHRTLLGMQVGVTLMVVVVVMTGMLAVVSTVSATEQDPVRVNDPAVP
jgi:hypothetical protein